MSIISKIQEILDERGITAAQMSRDLGFSSGLFSQWKRGAQEPRKKSVEAIADYLLGRENTAELLPQRGLRFVPVFETVAAGFGAYADSCPVGVVADYIESDYDAENTIAIKVRGDSMYPKIEDGAARDGNHRRRKLTEI